MSPDTGEASGIAKHTAGVVESIRVLREAPEGAIRARTAALAQLRDLLVTDSRLYVNSSRSGRR